MMSLPWKPLRQSLFHFVDENVEANRFLVSALIHKNLESCHLYSYNKKKAKQIENQQLFLDLSENEVAE